MTDLTPSAKTIVLIVEDDSLVRFAKDETVSVQGRLEHGFLHAAYIVHADGKVLGLDFPPAVASKRTPRTDGMA